MSWADFRGKLLGPTDPASAPEGSLRKEIYSKWSDLGILEEYMGGVALRVVGLKWIGCMSPDDTLFAGVLIGRGI